MTGRRSRPRTDASEEVRWSSSAAHPLRIKILWRFVADSDAPLSPKSLADAIAEPLVDVSYHVRQLLTDRLIRRVKRVARRGAFETYYVLEDPDRTAALLWGRSASLLRLPGGDAFAQSDATMLVDLAGLAEVRALTDRYLTALSEVAYHVRERADGEAPVWRVAILLGGDDAA